MGWRRPQVAWDETVTHYMGLSSAQRLTQRSPAKAVFEAHGNRHGRASALRSGNQRACWAVSGCWWTDSPEQALVWCEALQQHLG
jgi:hypothetical protein